MNTLNSFKSEFYKLRKLKVFYICLIACVAAAFLVPLAIKQAIATGELFSPFAIGSIDALFYSLGMPILSLIIAVFVSIFVSSEFHNGTMKNIVSKGVRREVLFLAKFTVCALAATAMYIFYIAFAICSGAIFLGFDPNGTFAADTFIGVVCLIWLLLLAYTAVFTAFGMLLRSNGASIAVNICLVSIFPTLLNALDYLFHFSGFKISSLWIDGNLTAIATMSPASGDIISASVVGIVWLAIAVTGGILLFKKHDIK